MTTQDLDAAGQKILAHMLARLTRKGARLETRPTGYLIVYPGERVRTATAAARDPDRHVAQALVEAAISAGWIATDGMIGSLRLTETGALHLKLGHPTAAPRGALTDDRQAGRALPTATATGGPIARMRHKRDARGAPLVTSLQVEAAERLARDFNRGQMQPRVTANWDRAALGFSLERRPGAAGDISDGASAAQERVRRALADAGAEFSDLLVDACCLDIGLEAIEQRRAWPPRTARVVLGLALDRLARHYGMVGQGPARGRPGHWGAADYKPTQSRV